MGVFLWQIIPAQTWTLGRCFGLLEEQDTCTYIYICIYMGNIIVLKETLIFAAHLVTYIHTLNTIRVCVPWLWL